MPVSSTELHSALTAVARVSPEWPYGAIRVSSAVPIGAGYGLSDGEVQRVAARTEVGDAVSFVLKREGARAVEGALRFHRSVGPLVAGSVPTCLGGLVDEGRETGLLVLEDVAPARQGDVLRGCGDADAHAALRALARVHAASQLVLESAAPPDLPRWAPRRLPADDWEARLAAAAERFPQLLTPALTALLARLPEASGPALEALGRRRPCCVHGDAHLDNVLFRPDGSAVLLDWSGVSVGAAAVDLARLLTEGIDAGSRGDRAGELLAVYVDELGDAGGELEDDACWDALSHGLVPLLETAVAWAARAEEREPRRRLRALQENLLRSVCAWAEGEQLARPGRVFAR